MSSEHFSNAFIFNWSAIYRKKNSIAENISLLEKQGSCTDSKEFKNVSDGK